jgi:hypothetical protein
LTRSGAHTFAPVTSPVRDKITWLAIFRRKSALDFYREPGRFYRR